MTAATRKKLQQLADFYDSEFKESKTNAEIITKSLQTSILIEQSNCLSHLSVLWRNRGHNTNQDIIDSNIEKAQNHLNRSCLDCQKLIWQALVEDFKFAIKDRFRLNCFSEDEHQVTTMYNNMMDKSAEARNFELTNVGLGVESSIRCYSKLWNQLKNLLFATNNGDLVATEMDRIKSKLWSFIGSVFGGLISGLAIYAIAKWI